MHRRRDSWKTNAPRLSSTWPSAKRKLYRNYWSLLRRVGVRVSHFPVDVTWVMLVLNWAVDPSTIFIFPIRISPGACIDDQGRPRQIGDTWADSEDACLTNTCLRPDLIIKSLPSNCSTLDPAVHDDCDLHRVDCCWTWKCPDSWVIIAVQYLLVCLTDHTNLGHSPLRLWSC